MKEIKVAKRYASALFQFAQESKQLDAVYNDMSLVAQVCQENKEFRMLLSSPVVANNKKISVLEALFSSSISDITMKYLSIITSKGRENIVHDIAEQLIVLYKEHKGILSLELKTAFELKQEERERILKLLKESTKANDIDLTETIDPELIGGFILSWDNKQIDATLQRRLRELKKDFENNVYLRSI
jgi:F-type H+-transporting ATPase subunit delta